MGASFYGSASCSDATGYELYVIASAVVGGASLSGGKQAPRARCGAILIVLIRQSIRHAALRSELRVDHHRLR
jgi:ribose transport system permease protein